MMEVVKKRSSGLAVGSVLFGYAGSATWVTSRSLESAAGFTSFSFVDRVGYENLEVWRSASCNMSRTAVLPLSTSLPSKASVMRDAKGWS